MGQALLAQMLPSLNKIEWPTNPAATALGWQTFEVGLEKIDEFTGDLKTLGAALRTLQSGDSQPYAFAGVAYALVAAAQENDGTYARSGLDAAMSWLEKAQSTAPDIVDINMIEALIYIYSGRFDDARLILDYLENIQPGNYYVLRAEIAYWQQQQKLQEAVNWYQKAINTVSEVPRKLGLRRQLGDCYLEFGKYDQALTIYKDALHFAPEDPWLWHNMSVAHWHMKNYDEALRCNKKALSLQDLPIARQMEGALREKLGTAGLMGRLLGR